MKFLSSLDAKDRKLLLWCVGIGLALAILTGFLMPNNGNDNPLPSSYLAGRHGARAAYETLLRSGYQIQRWERPLSDLAETAGPDTVVIFAQPYIRNLSDLRAVRTIVERGGRVLATGLVGGFLLPNGAGVPPKVFDFSACKLSPQGLDALANSGQVWMIPEAAWKLGNPTQRVEYTCAGQPSVIEYNWGKGHVVWWASSTPLENAMLSRADDLELLLNSIGPRQGHRFYWDESLHGDIQSSWTYAAGPSLTLLQIGLAVLGLLVVFSFSRRSGPVRDLPAPARATPVEFLEALGSLYKNAGAASTAVGIAWERFRARALRLCGLRGRKMGAAELAATVRRRFGHSEVSLAPEFEADLAACEEASWSETIQPRAALRLIQKLHGHEERLMAAVKSVRNNAKSIQIHSEEQERAS
ncbi:MAG: DUF4350 domain-containing protein [Terracidiphilus sp.]